MPQKEIPLETIQITERFFQAISDLQDRHIIRGLGTLARKWDSSRFNLSVCRSNPTERRLNLEYLYYIVRDYRISPTWLMTGKGDMYL